MRDRKMRKKFIGIIVLFALIMQVAIPVNVYGEDILQDNNNTIEGELTNGIEDELITDNEITGGNIKAGVALLLNDVDTAHNDILIDNNNSQEVITSDDELLSNSIIEGNLSYTNQSDTLSVYDENDNNQSIENLVEKYENDEIYVSEVDAVRTYAGNSSGYISKEGKYIVARTEAPKFSSIYSSPNGTETDFYFCTSMNPFCSGTLYPRNTNDGNCTWYAYGRASEILGERAWFLPTGAAGNWYSNVTSTRKIDKAELGAIACWSNHVAVVEWLNDDGETMIISESSSGSSGTPMYWNKRTVSRTNPKNGSQTFYGFIKVGDFEQYKGGGTEDDHFTTPAFSPKGRTVRDDNYVLVSAISEDESTGKLKSRPYVLCLYNDNVEIDRALNEDSSVLEVELQDTGFYNLYDRSLKQVVDLEEASKEEKVNIWYDKWNQDYYCQQWSFYKDSDHNYDHDYYLIRNAGSGLFLTVDSKRKNIYQMEEYDSDDEEKDAQRWMFVLAEKPEFKTTELADGTVEKKYSKVLKADSDLDITWEMYYGDSLPEGLQLTAEGEITGTPVKDGTYSFRVTAGNAFGWAVQTYELIINKGIDSDIKVSGITLNKATSELKVGQNETLAATVSPVNATNKTLNWTTDNSKVATVDANGKVTAVAAGTAKITAASTDGSNKSATCTVTVAPQPSSDAVISVGEVTAKKGDTIEVPVNINMAQGAKISGMAIEISCDPHLSIVGVERGTLLTKGTFNDEEIGKGVLQWYTTGTPIGGEGEIFRLKVKVDVNAEDGSYPISINYKDNKKANITDDESNNVEVRFVSGAVNIPKTILGDLTGDGEIAMGDVVKLAKAVAGSITLTDNEKLAGDVTRDGDVAMGDVVKLARFVAGSITEL